MSTTAESLSPAPARPNLVRPAWARWGGAGIVLGGTLLLLATVVEAVVFVQPTAFWTALFGVLLLGSVVAYALAMLPLALGTTGADGIVGDSLLGRAALLGFGAAFLALEIDYFDVAYLLPPVDDYSASNSLSFGIGIVQTVLLLTAAVVIVRAKVATGAARWALFAFAIAGAVTGAIADAAGDMVTVTVAHLLSTVVQIIVGIIIATARVEAA